MRSIEVFGKEVTGWQVLPADEPDFEEMALQACEFVPRGRSSGGKVPGARRAKGSGERKTAKSAKQAKAKRGTAKKRAGS